MKRKKPCDPLAALLWSVGDDLGGFSRNMDHSFKISPQKKLQKGRPKGPEAHFRVARELLIVTFSQIA